MALDRQTRSQESQPSPLSRSRFTGFLTSLPAGTRRNPGGLRGALTTYNSWTSRFPGPSGPEDRVPEHVDYGEKCRLLCLETSPPRVCKVYTNLLASFCAICAQIAKTAADVAKACSLVFIEASLPAEDVEDEIVVRQFVYLAAAQSRSGRFPAKQNFVLCDVLEAVEGSGDVAGTKVRLAQHDRAAHNSPLPYPLSCQSSGMYRYALEEELALQLIKAPQRPGVADADFVAPVIAMQLVEYEDESLDVMLVTGFKKDSEPMLVDGEERAEADSGAAEDLPPPPPPPPPPGGFDLLDAFSDGEGDGGMRANCSIATPTRAGCSLLVGPKTGLSSDALFCIVGVMGLGWQS